MSLSVTTIIDGVNCAWKLGHGLEKRMCDITSSDVSVDYSNGFDVNSLAGNLGLGQILGIDGPPSIRTAAGVHYRFVGSWDVTNKRLMILKDAGVAGALAQVVADTDIVDGDIVRVTLIGGGP